MFAEALDVEEVDRRQRSRRSQRLQYFGDQHLQIVCRAIDLDMLVRHGDEVEVGMDRGRWGHTGTIPMRASCDPITMPAMRQASPNATPSQMIRRRGIFPLIAFGTAM